MSVGFLAEPWNEFDVWVQELGWGEENIVSPTMVSSMELRLHQIPDTTTVLPGLDIFENFETGFTTWTNTGGDDNNCWFRDSLGTPTTNTGPSTGADGTIFYIFYEASDGCSFGISPKAFLQGPTIDFDAFNSVEVTFWRHMFGNQMGRLALELETSPDSGTYTEVWFEQGNKGDQWDQFTVDLSFADNTGQRKVRFVATETVAGIRSDMAVDEIRIKGATGASVPINLITSCIFRSPESIPAGTGLSQGSAICKLLNAPHDEGGVSIAEGRAFFNSYPGNNADLEVLITQKIFENSNNNELIKDVKFIIEAPI